MSGRQNGNRGRGRGGRGGRGGYGDDAGPPGMNYGDQPAMRQPGAPSWGPGPAPAAYGAPPPGLAPQQAPGGHQGQPPPQQAYPPAPWGAQQQQQPQQQMQQQPQQQMQQQPQQQMAPPPQQAYAPGPTPMQYAQEQVIPQQQVAQAAQMAPAPAPAQHQPGVAPPAQAALARVPARPAHPGFGTKGRQVKILANWFKVEFKAQEVYQYAVHIKKLFIEEEPAPGAEGGGESRRPARPPRNVEGPLPSILCRAAIAKLSEEMRWPNGIIAFDGRANLYTASVATIPGDVLEREVITILPGEKKPVKFAIKIERVAILSSASIADFFAGKGDPTAPHHILQALDVVLKHRMGMNALTNPNIMIQGRSFLSYDQNTARQSIGGGAQCWLGYKQAIRPAQFGLSLTVDTAAGAVWDVGNPAAPRKLSDLMYDICGGRDRVPAQGLAGPQLRRCDKELRGMRIQASHNGFKRTVVGLARNTPFTEKFATANGQQTTVAKYFQTQYNVNITDQRLPCIKVGNGKSLLPAEVCVVLPKQRVRKMTGDQTAGMIKHAAQRPQDKQKFIQSKLQEVAKEAQPEMSTFGIKVNGQMVEASGRVLPNPKLMYGGGPRNASFDPKNFGSWNLKDLPFLEGKQMQSWAVVSFTTKRWEVDGLPDFLKELVRVARLCGMDIARDPPVHVARGGNAAVAPLLQRAAEDAMKKFRKRPELILVVLPDTGVELYKEIKQAGDSGMGVPTQCIVAQKAKIGAREARGQVQYIANVCLKINAKLGGRNVALSPSTISSASDFMRSFGQKPFCVMGADVTHPGIGSTAPSVAAVVCSLDATASRYATRISAQAFSSKRQSEEIIQDLKNMAKELLLEFYRGTGGKRPERIFFYRDGVSEGQYDQVLAFEYTALKQACAELGDPASGYSPPITFITSQKRHQTRLFAKDNRDTDRSGNLVPGVVIDRDLIAPNDFGFFLNAHSGLQGTNKPIKYSVLVDENKFSVDALQEFTYWLSYLFCRCTRSISVTAPVMYAHLAAFRGRTLLRGGDSDSETSSMMSGEGAPPELMPVHPNLSGCMFYV